MNFIDWLWNSLFPKKKVMARDATPEMVAAVYARLRSDSFTDEDYRRIYGDDEAAIAKAKAAWARSGELVIEDNKKRLGGAWRSED